MSHGRAQGPRFHGQAAAQGVWLALDVEGRLCCPGTLMGRLTRCFANRELHQDNLAWELPGPIPCLPQQLGAPRIHPADPRHRLPAEALGMEIDPQHPNAPRSCWEAAWQAVTAPRSPRMQSGGVEPLRRAPGSFRGCWCRRRGEYLESSFRPSPHRGPCGHSNVV